MHTVVKVTINLHALIRLYLEVLPLCVSIRRSLHFLGEVVVAILVLAMEAMLANIIQLSSLEYSILPTLVFDLILILHGCRNLSRSPRAKAWMVMLTMCRQPWRSARVMAE